MRPRSYAALDPSKVGSHRARFRTVFFSWPGRCHIELQAHEEASVASQTSRPGEFAVCGIAGIIGDSARDRRFLANMDASLVHRGPDDHGLWLDEEASVALVHRRLSIVDLSPSGRQPMESSDGRFVLTFNGEIYNHVEIRRELEAAGGGVSWRGHSDTETLLEAIAYWGLSSTLDRAVGMFAIALWDKKQRKLSLVRDRFGEKPLYYGWV